MKADAEQQEEQEEDGWMLQERGVERGLKDCIA